MKKGTFRLLATILSLAVLLTAFLPMNLVSADGASAEPAETNLLEGLIPTDFYRADIGTPQTCNYGTFSIANVGDGYHPYLYNWTDQKARIQPYIATATDGDATTKNSYRLTDSWVMIYDLGEATVLKDFEIKIGTHAGNQNSAVVKVYTAADRGAIFSSEPAATMDINWGGGGTATLNKWARFVAVVHEKRSGSTEWYSAIREITVTGSKTLSNVLAGAIPVQFCSVNTDTYGFNWTQTKVSKNGTTYQNHGFTPSDGWGRRDAFAEYLALMTDEDDSVRLGIEPENRSTSKVDMVYELDGAYDIEAVQVVMNAYDDSCDVFVSSDRGTLFDSENKIGNIARDGNAYTTPDTLVAGVENARFVGIYMRDVYQSGICEIRVFAEPKADENLLKGLLPVAGYPVNDGTTTFSYNSFRIYKGSTKNVIRFAYGTRPGKPSDNDVTGSSDPTSDFAVFTDAVTASGNRKVGNDKGVEDVLLAYKLNSMSQINSIVLNSGTIPVGTSVYLSDSYASLFNAANLAGTYTENASDTGFTISFAQPKTALYIGFVFDTSSNNMQIIELEARGNAYPDKTYNTVLGGKSLINASASNEAKSFYNYLGTLGKGNGTLLGAEINLDEYSNIDTRGANDNYYEYLEQLYGKTPVIVSTQWKLDSSLYKQYYDEGSIPMISVGLSSETANGLENRTGCIKYYDSTYTPSLSEQDLYDDIQEEVEDSLRDLGDFFEELEDAGVKAYIVRPFIEMNHKGQYGNNRWGNDTRQNFKNVWQQMVDYLVDERGLTGIMFAFAPVAYTSSTSYFPPMDYYPGDDYVDIIAPTFYSQTNDGVLPVIEDYADMIATGKPFAMSETGLIKTYTVTTRTDCMNLLNSIKTSYPEATFINLWYGTNLSITVHSNPAQFIGDDYIIGAKDAPKYQSGEIGAPVEVYASSDYSGNCTAVLEGRYTASTGSALKIQSGYQITLYANADYTGEEWLFGRDVADLAAIDANAFASVKVEEAAPFTVGNVNDDGAINILDLIRIKKHTASAATCNKLAADLNNDGKINALDLTALTQQLLAE